MWNLHELHWHWQIAVYVLVGIALIFQLLLRRERRWNVVTAYGLVSLMNLIAAAAIACWEMPHP